MARAPIPTWYLALVVVRRGHRFLLTQERKSVAQGGQVFPLSVLSSERSL